jgi:hypothetical protein
VADVNLVADRGVTRRQQAFYGAMAGDLHQTDHRRGRERALAADVVREELALDDTLGSALDAGLDPLDGLHSIDCPQ